MTEGLHAKITADTESFEDGIKRSESVFKSFTIAADNAQSKVKAINTQFRGSIPNISGYQKTIIGLKKQMTSLGDVVKTNSARLGQAGIQFQQFAGQVQGGTNVFTAFSQQAADLGFVLGFPLLGAVTGLAAGLAGPLITSLMQTEDSTGDLKTRMNELADEMGKVADISSSMAIFNFNAQIMAASDETDKLNTKLSELQERRNKISSVTQGAGLLSAIKVEQEIEALDAEISKVRDLIDIEDARARVASNNIGKVFQLMEAARLKEIENENKKNNIITTNAVDAESKRAAMRAALIASTQGLEIESETLKHQKRLELISTAFADEQEGTYEHHAVLEAEQERHEQAISDIMSGHIHQRLMAEKQVQDGIQNMRANAVNNGVALLNVFAGKSKAAAIAAIALSKGLMIAQTIQSTAAAQMRALAELGPIAGPPAAAKIGFLGKVNIALIAATGLAQASGAGGGGASSSSGGGGVVGGGSALAASAPASENSIVNVNLVGNNFDRSSVEGLFEQINEGVERGYRINLA